MSNRYYIKRGDFGNVYSLCYAPESVDPGDGWERISRKEAESYAAAEARRRKDDEAFAYRADSYVYPYGMSEADEYAFECRHNGWHTVGRIAVRGSK